VVPGTTVVLVSLCGTEPSLTVDIKGPVVPGVVFIETGVSAMLGVVMPGAVSLVVPITGVVDFGSKYGRYPVA